jgi:hypothetical protein
MSCCGAGPAGYTAMVDVASVPTTVKLVTRKWHRMVLWPAGALLTVTRAQADEWVAAGWAVKPPQ